MSQFCSSCGQEVIYGGTCNKCGHRNGSLGRGLLLGAGSVIVLLAIGAWIVGASHKSANVDPASGRTEVGATLHTSALSQPAFVVAPGRYVSWPFTVTADMRRALVAGHFEAQGGANDIRVIIVDPDGMENFSNGHEFREYYDSGKVTTDTLHVGPLAAGSYYLVFSNTYSIVSNKAVTSDVHLNWYQ